MTCLMLWTTTTPSKLFCKLPQQHYVSKLIHHCCKVDIVGAGWVNVVDVIGFGDANDIGELVPYVGLVVAVETIVVKPCSFALTNHHQN